MVSIATSFGLQNEEAGWGERASKIHFSDGGTQGLSNTSQVPELHQCWRPNLNPVLLMPSPTGLPSTLSSPTRNAGLLNVYSAVQGRYSSQCIPVNQGACLHGRTGVPSLWVGNEALLEELNSNPILNLSLFLSAPPLAPATHFWRHSLVVQLKLA